jgi:hypothetical protein
MPLLLPKALRQKAKPDCFAKKDYTACKGGFFVAVHQAAAQAAKSWFLTVFS